MKIGGFNTEDPAGLQGAIKAIGPMLAEEIRRVFGSADTLLDRVDGAIILIPEIRIEVRLKPIPKATPANPAPD